MLNGRCLNWKTDFRRFFVFFDFSSFISSDDFFQQLIWFNFFRRVHMSAVVQWNSLLPYFDKSEGSNPRSFFTILTKSEGSNPWPVTKYCSHISIGKHNYIVKIFHNVQMTDMVEWYRAKALFLPSRGFDSRMRHKPFFCRFFEFSSFPCLNVIFQQISTRIRISYSQINLNHSWSS